MDVVGVVWKKRRNKMNSTERLLEIKKQIDEAVPKQSEITGKIKSEEERTLDQFGVKEIPEMEDMLKDIGDKIDDQENEFKNDMKKLEDSYEWD